MNRLFLLGRIIILALLWGWLVGCASSPPTRLYLLNGLESPGREAKAMSGESCDSIGVGPVKVSDYLDRPQIVTRVASNELRLAEFDRWAEPPAQMISRALANNLTTLLCTKTVAVFPWRGSIPIDYQVEMEILRLDGSLGGNATIEAQWMIFSLSGGKKLQAIKNVSFTETTGGQSYAALVSAQSQALGQLSRKIAEAIKALPK